MIMEIRSAKTLKLLDTISIKNRRKYYKMCKKLTKIVEKHNSFNKNGGELLIRIRPHSYLVMSRGYGYVIGLKESKTKWI